jgi:hypothetical protein
MHALEPGEQHRRENGAEAEEHGFHRVRVLNKALSSAHGDWPYLGGNAEWSSVQVVHLVDVLVDALPVQEAMDPVEVEVLYKKEHNHLPR